MQSRLQKFGKSLKSMLKVDFRRLLSTPLFYIMVGVCLVIPILILVMTTMMAGSTTTDPITGDIVPMETFTNVWQTIGSVSGESSAMNMSLTGMCNINMLYFFIAILVCIFIAEDFKSGYAKNLFTVRSKKIDYVVSKTIIGLVGGACMIIAYFIGAMVGGAIAQLSFDVGAAGITGIFMCMLSKIFLVAVFVPIYVAVSVAAKQRAWLSVIGSLCVGMLLFTMVPMISPLNSTIVNVVMCLAGGTIFCVGLGMVSNLVLNKTSLV